MRLRGERFPLDSQTLCPGLVLQPHPYLLGLVSHSSQKGTG